MNSNRIIFDPAHLGRLSIGSFINDSTFGPPGFTTMREMSRHFFHPGPSDGGRIGTYFKKRPSKYVAHDMFRMPNFFLHSHSFRMASHTPFNILRSLHKALALHKPHLGAIRHPFTAVTDSSRQHLEEVAGQSREILFKANTVFPFNLFPDTVTLDREKITFAERIFFRVAKVISVPVRDILSVEIDVGPFFGSIHMKSRYFNTNPTSIRFLWRKEADKLHKLLQGFIVAHEGKLDCSKLNKEELMNFLHRLGKSDLD